MYKTFGETAQVSPNVVLRLHQDHAQTERLYLTHHGSYCSPYLCQPNRAAKKHGAQLTEGNEQELLVCCRVIITLSAAWLLGECPSKTRSRWAGAASRELGRALRARLPPRGCSQRCPESGRLRELGTVSGARAAPGLCAHPGWRRWRCAELHSIRPSALPRRAGCKPHQATPIFFLLLHITRQQTAPRGQQEITHHFLPLPAVFVIYTQTHKLQQEQADLRPQSEVPPTPETDSREAHWPWHGKGWLHSSAAASCSLQPKPALWALHPARSPGAVFTKKFL